MLTRTPELECKPRAPVQHPCTPPPWLVGVCTDHLPGSAFMSAGKVFILRLVSGNYRNIWAGGLGWVLNTGPLRDQRINVGLRYRDTYGPLLLNDRHESTPTYGQG